MPGSTGPNLGLVWDFALHEAGWGVDGYNPGFLELDTIVQLSVLDTLVPPPGSPAAGDRYIVGPSATGAWATHDGEVAVWNEIGSSAWVFFVPKVGWRTWHVADDEWKRYDGADWVSETPVVAAPMRGVSFGSDPTALLTADQEVFYHRFAFPFTIPADFADYDGSSTTMGGTALATADVVWRIQKAVDATPLTFSTVGTITTGLGTVNISDQDSSGIDIVFAKNDIIRVLAPTVPDATFKGLFGTFVGSQS